MTMRFKPGRLVEVFTKHKVPSGVWRCAEIVADNGDGYTVRYYRPPSIFKGGVDKVSHEAVRPCSPSTSYMVWAVGDVAEVLDGGYWKVSVIEGDLGEGFYQIRVIGSLDEFRVNKSNIRMRQEWKDNMWVSLGKDSENCEDLMIRIRKKEALMKQQSHLNNVEPIANDCSKSLKRSFSDLSYTDEDDSDCTHYRRAGNKEVKLNAFHADSYSFIGKADPHWNSKEFQSIQDQTILLARVSEPTDCVSVLSSVASCSIIDPLLDRVRSDASTSCSQDDDSFCSDAESSNPSGDEEGNSIGEWQDEFQIHELDLRSYRCFLEALYASGPLNWEHEFLLTNIRMKLCVTNDEHLIELKRLKCIGGSALISH